MSVTGRRDLRSRAAEICDQVQTSTRESSCLAALPAGLSAVVYPPMAGLGGGGSLGGGG
jgi:hypothetical protein